jgi:glycolate oxidase
VGVEKRELMREQFTASELTRQRAIKQLFDPDWLLNPHKVFPLAESPL